jgi:hypothetical protein
MMHPDSAAPQHADGTLTFLTQTEAARLLRLSGRSLERFRLTGAGPAFRKFGRRVLYGRADVLAWANARRRSSTSDPGLQA